MGQIFPLELLESGSEAKPYLEEELLSSGYQNHSTYLLTPCMDHSSDKPLFGEYNKIIWGLCIC